MRLRRACAVAVVAGLLAAAPIRLSAPPAAATARPSPYLQGLAFPTNMAFAPDGRLFYTEKETGRIRIVKDGVLQPGPFATLPVEGDAERGLLGIALDPHFATRPWVYVYFSDANDGRNRLVRLSAQGDVGGPPQLLLRGLDASSGYHNGGDIAFGVDGKLYLSVGESHDPGLAQDLTSIGGKILRLNPDGTIPADDPFSSTAAPNPAYSVGNRNSFGLCVDPSNGNLWETENGPDVDDEINLIRAGGNYGWPIVTGVADRRAFVDPVAVFHRTVALTGCAVVGGAVYVGAYNDGLLRVLRDGTLSDVASFPAGVTDVELGPDGSIYVSTTGAIYRLAPPTGSPEASGSTGTRRWVALAAAVALVAALIVRFVAGRRLRRAGKG